MTLEVLIPSQHQFPEFLWKIIGSQYVLQAVVPYFVENFLSIQKDDCEILFIVCKFVYYLRQDNSGKYWRDLLSKATLHQVLDVIYKPRNLSQKAYFKKFTKTADDGDSSVVRWEFGVLDLLQNWVDDAILKHGGDETVYQHAVKQCGQNGGYGVFIFYLRILKVR